MDIVSESNAFELHPVSGEIDYGEVDKLGYRRLDDESLQARIEIASLGLLIVYLWCTGDAEGGRDGWLVSEVRPLDGEENAKVEGIAWADTISEAEERARERDMAEALKHGEANSLGDGIPTIQNGAGQDHKKDEDDDADYWARYDNTPGRTPAPTPGPKYSPLPDQDRPRPRSTSEAEYYARYAQVQPEMDNDDPHENRDAIGESTLNGNALASVMSHSQGAVDGIHAANGHQAPVSTGLMIDSDNSDDAEDATSQPSAHSPVSVQRLEDSAELQSVAEVSIKQHVSTSVKSLFRLCRSTGMDIDEFNEMVRIELDTLSMMTEDD